MATGRLYLQPFGCVDAPQKCAGKAFRLAGGMQWFDRLELTLRCDSGFDRHVFSVEAADEIRASLTDELCAEFDKQWTGLTTGHPPIRFGERVLRFDQPQVMAIVNVTPDSFSDGGKFMDDPDVVADQAFAFYQSGAAILDIGGESTRPDAQAVWEGDEIKRIIPVVEKLSASGAIVSVDTRKAGVMKAALEAGAHIINDVSALLHDRGALDVVKASHCPLVIMHAPSQGQNPHADGNYDHVVFDVFDWLEGRVDALMGEGIDKQRLIVDPGFGFGKSVSENIMLFNALPLLHAIGCPVAIGVSRKRMIGALSNSEDAAHRLGGSVALATKAFDAGVQIVRVHDVADTLQAARVWRGLRDGALSDFTTIKLD